MEKMLVRKGGLEPPQTEVHKILSRGSEKHDIRALCKVCLICA
jgi:hypothetical protein